MVDKVFNHFILRLFEFNKNLSRIPINSIIDLFIKGASKQQPK